MHERRLRNGALARTDILSAFNYHWSPSDGDITFSEHRKRPFVQERVFHSRDVCRLYATGTLFLSFPFFLLSSFLLAPSPLTPIHLISRHFLFHSPESTPPQQKEQECQPSLNSSNTSPNTPPPPTPRNSLSPCSSSSSTSTALMLSAPARAAISSNLAPSLS